MKALGRSNDVSRGRAKMSMLLMAGMIVWKGYDAEPWAVEFTDTFSEEALLEMRRHALSESIDYRAEGRQYLLYMSACTRRGFEKQLEMLDRLKASNPEKAQMQFADTQRMILGRMINKLGDLQNDYAVINRMWSRRRAEQRFLRDAKPMLELLSAMRAEVRTNSDKEKLKVLTTKVEAAARMDELMLLCETVTDKKERDQHYKIVEHRLRLRTLHDCLKKYPRCNVIPAMHAAFGRHIFPLSDIIGRTRFQRLHDFIREWLAKFLRCYCCFKKSKESH